MDHAAEHMIASTKCLDLIMSCEALRLTAYKPTHLDSEPWTIGYGHTRDVPVGRRKDAA
jgi:GH24 family phage-related lysozyme (muramidase)